MTAIHNGARVVRRHDSGVLSWGNELVPKGVPLIVTGAAHGGAATLVGDEDTDLVVTINLTDLTPDNFTVVTKRVSDGEYNSAVLRAILAGTVGLGVSAEPVIPEAEIQPGLRLRRTLRPLPFHNDELPPGVELTITNIEREEAESGPITAVHGTTSQGTEFSIPETRLVTTYFERLPSAQPSPTLATLCATRAESLRGSLRYNCFMKLYSWNVNGIRAVLRKDLFAPFLESEQPDILCLQETKAQPEEIETGADGYHTYINSAERKGYSGTAILTRTDPIRTEHNLPPNLIAKYELTADKYGDANTEGRVLMAEFGQFYLVTVYTPNAKDDLSRIPLRQNHWDPAFLEYCKGLELGKYGPAKPVVFCGDLNVAHTPLDLARPKPNEGKKGYTAEERAGFQAFIDAGFVDTFRLFHQGNGYYTWWAHFGNARANNVGWRIDYFLVSASLKDKVKAANIHPAILGSDHCPISLELDL